MSAGRQEAKEWDWAMKHGCCRVARVVSEILGMGSRSCRKSMKKPWSHRRTDNALAPPPISSLIALRSMPPCAELRVAPIIRRWFRLFEYLIASGGKPSVSSISYMAWASHVWAGCISYMAWASHVWAGWNGTRKPLRANGSSLLKRSVPTVSHMPAGPKIIGCSSTHGSWLMNHESMNNRLFWIMSHQCLLIQEENRLFWIDVLGNSEYNLINLKNKSKRSWKFNIALRSIAPSRTVIVNHVPPEWDF